MIMVTEEQLQLNLSLKMNTQMWYAGLRNKGSESGNLGRVGKNFWSRHSIS